MTEIPVPQLIRATQLVRAQCIVTGHHKHTQHTHTEDEEAAAQPYVEEIKRKKMTRRVRLKSSSPDDKGQECV